MVQLEVLAGQPAAAKHSIGSFPCVVGRSPTAAVQITQPGVFDRHLELSLKEPAGFELAVLPSAVGLLNGRPFDRAILRNGDLIEIGSAKLRFWLAETRQRGQQWREVLTWGGLTALCLAQVALIYALSH